MALAPARADFLAEYPEFNGATTTLIDAKLAAAARRTNADVFQSDALCTDAIMLRAAILLLRSPYGKQMRQNNPDQVFTWEYELNMLQRSATVGLRIF